MLTESDRNRYTMRTLSKRKLEYLYYYQIDFESHTITKDRVIFHITKKGNLSGGHNNYK